MVSMLRCVEIGSGFQYCDPTRQESCFLDIGGKHYLKKDRLNYNDSGLLDHVEVFRSEGILGYSSEDLAADTLLVQHSNWDIPGTLKIEEDSIVVPVHAKIHEIRDIEPIPRIYASTTIKEREWMYVIEFLK
jgi:hypothetical protein